MTTAIQSDRLTWAIEGAVAQLTLNNPPLNVIDLPMMEALSAALSKVESESATSAIVVRGAGSCFSAGVDVAAHEPDQVASMLEKFHAIIRAVVASKKVTIAVVQGHCLGGGAELAMVCDIVITTDNARWGFPEISLGCYPPVAATALSALVGQKRAAELILTGRTISGREAAVIGLATEAAPESGLQTAVAERLDRLRNLSPAALAVTKKSIYAWDSMHFDKGLARAEKIYLEELMSTEDPQEGIRAFLEKRQPRWNNR
jgi:cyclohexa-1,5-dienecarbonyl-CoA hydratase